MEFLLTLEIVPVQIDFDFRSDFADPKQLFTYHRLYNLTFFLHFQGMGGLMSYFRGLFGSREMRILILGLDGAGKTTLLYRLQVS